MRILVDGNRVTDMYTLDEAGKPVPVFDVHAWAEWRYRHNPHIEGSPHYIGDVVRVSTVFLGIDHGFSFVCPESPPVLWETMIFGGEHDMYQRRYTSLAQAKEGHALTILMAEGKTTPEAIDEVDQVTS